jgi:pyruvate formate lyase activating enzyme
MIPIGGIVPFTTIDFPNKFSTVVFCQGCSWRCRYCHNPHLQPFTQDNTFKWDEFESFLKKRKGLLDAVVFSGGEPTLQPNLLSAIIRVKEFGFQIGIHTGGIVPARLKKMIPFVDWVGMDIKAPFAKYERITGRKDSGILPKQSAELLIHSNVLYEFRTTVHPDLLNEEDLLEIGDSLSQMGAKSFVLQKFRSTGCNDEMLNNSCTSTSFSKPLTSKLQSLFESFSVREE